MEKAGMASMLTPQFAERKFSFPFLDDWQCGLKRRLKHGLERDGKRGKSCSK
jgi:hypothetical protein